jgi:hypothetical protein
MTNFKLQHHRSNLNYQNLINLNSLKFLTCMNPSWEDSHFLTENNHTLFQERTCVYYKTKSVACRFYTMEFKLLKNQFYWYIPMEVDLLWIMFTSLLLVFLGNLTYRLLPMIIPEMVKVPNSFIPMKMI